MTDSLLTPEWIRTLSCAQQIYMGFSGGLDSAVLLHSLASIPQLSTKLCALHIHHGLSPYADAWQSHCEQYCFQLGIPFIAYKAVIETHANIEENARIARYAIFSSVLKEGDYLVLAHHGDDQAETVLLQLLRGAGIEGLAAMPPVRPLAKGQLARPLLSYPRSVLENYAAAAGLIWVEDESNTDEAYARNYLRHTVLPLLKKRWPNVNQTLARGADHCRAARENLLTLAAMDCPEIMGVKLSLAHIEKLSSERLINVLRYWFSVNAVRQPSTNLLKKLIEEVIFSRPDAQPLLQWSDISIRRYQGFLYLCTDESFIVSDCYKWPNFPAQLSLNKHLILDAVPASQGLIIPLSKSIEVRFRQGGEMIFWHGQTRALKKLLQQWQVPPWQRNKIALVFVNEKLAAVVGFAVSDAFYGQGKSVEIVCRRIEYDTAIN